MKRTKMVSPRVRIATALVALLAACCSPERATQCTFEERASFVVQACGGGSASTTLRGEGACANASITCTDFQEVCSVWSIGTSATGTCVLRLEQDGSVYARSVAIEFRDDVCQPRSLLVTGDVSVTVGPCQDGGAGGAASTAE